MKKSHIFLVWLLFLSASLFASAPQDPNIKYIKVGLITPSNACDIPAPNDFHTIWAGATWVEFSWTPIDLNAPHRIRTYRAIDGLLLNTTTVAAGTTNVTINNLPPNTACYSTINAICTKGGGGTEDDNNGPDSPPVAFHTIILDVIIYGFQPGSVNFCTLDNNNPSCEFGALGVTPFRASYLSNNLGVIIRQFGVTYDYNSERFKVYLGTTGNTNSPLKIYCMENVTPNCSEKPYFSIRYEPGDGSSVLLGKFEFGFGSNSNNLIRILQGNPLVSNFHLEQLTPKNSPGRPGYQGNSSLERNETQSIENFFAEVAPNPFSNSLDVYIGNLDAQKIHLQMFDLSGRSVLEQHLGGGQEQYTLPTENLSPGFYLLRVDIDGEVRTLKVVKSE